METQAQTPQVLKSFPKFDFKRISPLVIGSVIVVLLGLGTGWLVSGKLGGGATGSKGAPGAKVTQTEAGVLPKDFKGDNATGMLTAGGIKGEGTYHLTSDAGPSHYVYLTSGVIDLGSFVGKKVQVWGNTLAAKQAPWLMDVVMVKVVQ